MNAMKDLVGQNLEQAVKITGVTKTYSGLKNRKILNEMNLSIATGEVFGLLGPNGSGKTTLLKMLVGLLSPDKGEIRIFGKSPQLPQVRRSMGFLPERPYLYDFLTAHEFLEFYGKMIGLEKASLKDAISRALFAVNIRVKEGTLLRSFSKGMLQRMGIAQAIMHDPAILILDEPMSGLDPEGREELKALLARFAKEGKTIIFSSHVVSDVESLCSRAAFLKNGNLEVLLKSEKKYVINTTQGQHSATAAMLNEVLANILKSGGKVGEIREERSPWETLFLNQCETIKDTRI